MGNRVLLAMSGGIDSSAAAVILMERGYEVTGYTFRVDSVQSDAVERAADICEKLGIPHIYSDLTDKFNEKVIQYFKNEYEKGRTPNPCIRCNKDIKFGLIYDYALEMGFDYSASGHYASIKEKDGRFYLSKATDETRDQTYFLYILKEEQLRRVLFPLDGVPKARAREICSEARIMPADSKESREICFVNDNYKSFLTNELGAESKTGNFISKDGTVIDRHLGIMNYTVGQRKGLGIQLGKPGYIISINPKNGDIKIGSEEDLYKNEIYIAEINLINGKLPKSDDLYVKIRYGTAVARIAGIVRDKDKIIIRTEEKLRAPTPGQSAVIYDGDIVVGGGVII